MDTDDQTHGLCDIDNAKSPTDQRGAITRHQLPQIATARAKHRVALSKANPKNLKQDDCINIVPMEEIKDIVPDSQTIETLVNATLVLPTPPTSESNMSDESPKTPGSSSPVKNSPPTLVRLKIKTTTGNQEMIANNTSPNSSDSTVDNKVEGMCQPLTDLGVHNPNGTHLTPNTDNHSTGQRRTKTKGQIKKQLMKMKDRKAEQNEQTEKTSTPDEQATSQVQKPQEINQPKPSSVKTKVKPHDPDAELLVGDLLLGRVPGHPFWPCMVAYDPFIGIYTRSRNNKLREYHVQFFGDEGERGWVATPRLVPFVGKGAFETWCQEMRRKNKKDAKLYTINSSRRKAWEIGIKEATKAIPMSHQERKQIFTYRYQSAAEQLAPITPHTEPNDVDKKKSKKRKLDKMLEGESSPKSTPKSMSNPKKRQKRAHSTASASGESDPELSPSHIHLPEGLANQRVAQYMVFCQKRRDVIRREHPGYTHKQISDIMAQQWSELDEEQRSKYIPMGSDVKHISQIMSKNLAEEGSRAGRSIKPSKKKMEADQTSDIVTKKRKSHPTMAPRVVSPQSMDIRVSTSNSLNDVIDSVVSGEGIIKDTWDEDLLPVPLDDPDEVQEVTSSEDTKRKLKKNEKFAEDEDPSNRMSNNKDESSALRPWKPPMLPGDKGQDDYILEVFNLSYGTTIRKENICHICEQPGDLIQCEGPCNGTYHLSCLGLTVLPAGSFRCDECGSGRHTCFVCKQSSNLTRRCCVAQCGRYYHEDCIQKFSLTRIENNHITCPLHTCATCAAENPKGPKVARGRMYKCVRCPTAYHVGDFCIAAGCVHLAGLHIVCSRHFQPVKSQSHHHHINVSWCFICSRGGTLLCCESCPASFHADCLKINPPNEKWYCADCARGKRPLYGDIVWVKVGSYRWWPGEICQPKHVPHNIQDKAHQVGEFPIRFFGSHDYYWTHQARVFLFQEGDKGSKDTASGTSLARIFQKAVIEATAAFKLWRMAKVKKEEHEQEKNDRKPAPYKHTKSNCPIGNVPIYKADPSQLPRCECSPDQDNPCGIDAECLNRMMMYECHPGICPAQPHCRNQSFIKREYALSQPNRTPGRGWGLKALVHIKKGSFVNEYVGDLIDEEECRRRIKEAHDNDVTNFYMLTLDKNRVIDAGPKGNLSRFMNHSCQPNLETQKWNVNGDVRVGLFAIEDIQTGEELTFNYNLECLGNEKTACQCGAPNCSGFLGVRPKTALSSDTDKKSKDRKKKRKLKHSIVKEHDDECYRCGEGGELVMCDRSHCPKVYHLKCLKLAKLPTGKWICCWHHCDDCGKRSVRMCTECPNSFCPIHIENNIFQIGQNKLVCADHTELLGAVEQSKLTMLHNDPTLEAPTTSCSDVTSSESSPTHSDGESETPSDSVSASDTVEMASASLNVIHIKNNDKDQSKKCGRRNSRAGSGYSDSDISEGRLCIVEDPETTLTAEPDVLNPSSVKKRGRQQKPLNEENVLNTSFKSPTGSNGDQSKTVTSDRNKITPSKRAGRNPKVSTPTGTVLDISDLATPNTDIISKSNAKTKEKKSEDKSNNSPMFDDEDDFPDLVIDIQAL